MGCGSSRNSERRSRLQTSGDESFGASEPSFDEEEYERRPKEQRLTMKDRKERSRHSTRTQSGKLISWLWGTQEPTANDNDKNRRSSRRKRDSGKSKKKVPRRLNVLPKTAYGWGVKGKMYAPEVQHREEVAPANADMASQEGRDDVVYHENHEARNPHVATYVSARPERDSEDSREMNRVKQQKDEKKTASESGPRTNADDASEHNQAREKYSNHAGHSSSLDPQIPMNRMRSDLQINADTGPMSYDHVKEKYRALAKAYLASFANGIHRHMFFDVLRRRTYSLTPPGANKGVQSMLFQIIDSKVYLMDPYEVPKNSKPFYRSRINEIIWLLSRVAARGKIKNTEFMVSIHDCVQTVNKPHTYRGATYQESIPAFTIVSCNFSDNIPFPMWESDNERGGGFAGWDANMKEYGADSQAWSMKDDRAVFRGGNRPSMYFANKSNANAHCDDVGRTRLSHLSSLKMQYLDVSVGGTCGGVHHTLKRMNEKEQQQFKYVLYAEGNCFWADRLNKQVFGPSLIVKQETPCGQFWEPLLQPMTHYIPTDFFFSNLIEQVEWARDNDAKVRQIIQNANEFAHNFLSLQGIQAYVEALLEEYTSLLVEPDIKLETGATEVTNKRV